MADEVDKYQRTFAARVSKFFSDCEKEAKEINEINEELKKMPPVEEGVDEELDARVQELKDRRDELEKCIQEKRKKAVDALQTIPLPPQAPPKVQQKLPPWIVEVIKKGGIPLGKGWILKPDIDINWKTLEFKKFEIIFEVPLPF
jgi:hypothetical protein